jgi:hypothetical protein
MSTRALASSFTTRRGCTRLVPMPPSRGTAWRACMMLALAFACVGCESGTWTEDVVTDDGGAEASAIAAARTIDAGPVQPADGPSSQAQTDAQLETRDSAGPTLVDATEGDAQLRDASARPLDAAAEARTLPTVHCLAGGTLFTCDVLVDGGLVVRPGSNATVVWYPANGPAQACSTATAPVESCAPGTACRGELVQAGTVMTMNGVCE